MTAWLRLPRGNSLVWTIVGVLGVALYLFPIYWMFVSGLKTASEIFANPPTLFPRNPTLDTFEYVIVRESPGSPSQWIATLSPWPASTCRSTQL